MIKKNILAGLDIGTSMVCVAVAEVNSEAQAEIIGVGQSESLGLKKGMIIDIESTVSAITNAIEKAEQMADCQINSVVVGVTGANVKGIAGKGVVSIKGHEVEKADINRVMEEAKAVKFDSSEQLIHMLPHSFVLDGRTGVKNPLGISANQLERDIYIVTAPGSLIRNLEKCVSNAGLDVVELVLSSIGSGEAVLTKEEKELGVVLVDIGAEVIDIVIYMNSNVIHTSVLGVGGKHLTNDISIGLRTSEQDAERIKLENSNISTAFSNSEIQIEVPNPGGNGSRVVSKQGLMEIVEPRVVEMLEMVGKEIKKVESGTFLASGVVFTGGMSSMNGIDDLAKKMFDMPVRVATPKVGGDLAEIIASPVYSTVTGLINYGMSKADRTPKKRSWLYSCLASTGEWFRDHF